MRRTFLATALALSAAVWLAQPASAITNGTEDTANTYSNVGAMVWVDSDGLYEGLCSGSLLAAGSSTPPAQFLTAGHCTSGLYALQVPPEHVFVTFDPAGPVPIGMAPTGFPYVDVTGLTLIPASSYRSDPDYPAGPSPSGSDLGVITLAGPISDYYPGLTPVLLPPAGSLTQGDHRDFVTGVGYGMQASSPRGMAWSGVRTFADMRITAVQPAYLHTLQNAPATGGGGICGGDSGGPLFSGRYEVAVITWGAGRCGIEGMSPRLDNPAIQNWLAQFRD